MNKLPTYFFATGAIFALCGMAWGIYMSATQDHLLSPAHGHLNLIGFVAMSVFGTYFALSPKASASRLAWAQYGLTVAAVIIMVPGIVMAISGTGEALAKIGSVLAIAAMALFAYIVISNGVGAGQEEAGIAPAE